MKLQLVTIDLVIPRFADVNQPVVTDHQKSSILLEIMISWISFIIKLKLSLIFPFPLQKKLNDCTYLPSNLRAY